MGAAPQIYAASIGIQDSIFLMLLALVVFGPRRLPEIGRQIGKLMYEFRKVSNDFKFQMEEELRASEEAERQRKLQASLPPPAPTATLDVPPHPTPVEEQAATSTTEPAAESATEPQTPIASDEPSAAGESGEAQGEPRRTPPPPPQIQIQPPSTGEQVAAARPFRTSSPAEPETSAHPYSETVTDSGSEPVHETAGPVVVADEGRTGNELQPGHQAGNLADSEAHHG